MKLIYLLVIALAITAGMVLPASAAGDPTVQISEYKVSPSIMMPDSLGTITIVVKNTASSATMKENAGVIANDFATTKVTDINVNIENVQLEGKGVLVISKDFERVGEIGPGQSLPLTFTIRAPPETGMYYPEVWIDTTGGRSTRYPIPVNVNTPVGIQKKAIMIVESSLPDTVNPGDEIPVLLTVRNGGETRTDDVTVRINNVSSMIAPKKTDLYHLGAINANDSRTVNLVLLSDRNTPTGLVRVPVTLQYNWIDGSGHVETTSIDVLMKGKAELGFVSVDTSPRRVIANQPFDLTIRIENTGTGEAKQVVATTDLPMTGTTQSFIGKIKPGNDAPAVFSLDGAKGGTYEYTTVITYVDDLGTHTISSKMSVRVIPEDNTGMFILVLLIIIAGGILAYKYWYLPKKNGAGALPWVKKN
ncbi:MAG: S-layer protein [Methanomicrobiales archaeon]